MRKIATVLLLLSLSLLAGATTALKSVSLVTYGADTTGVNDVSGAFAAAIAAGASHIDVPPGQYLLNGTATVALNNVEVECHGAPAEYNTPPAYGTSGATFLMTSTTVQPFTIKGGVRIVGCNFFWPNQTGANPTPITYPPLFTEPTGSQLVSFECYSCRVIDAFDFLDQASASDAIGDIKLVNTMGYAIRYWFQLANVTEWITITGFHADAAIYQGVSNVGPNYYLVNWTAANGAFLHVFGNGNGSTVGSSVRVGGLTFVGDVFGYNKFVWVDSTGFISESKFHGILDTVPKPFEVDAGGCASQVEMDVSLIAYLGVFPNPAPGGSDSATAYSFSTPPTSVCTTNDIRLTGDVATAQGDVVDIAGTGNKAFYISLSGGGPFGATSAGGTFYFAQVNSSTAIVDFVGNHIETTAGHVGSTRLGINFINCLTCTATGNSFNGIYNPLLVQSSTIRVMASGNVSTSTPAGGTAVIGTGDFVHQLLTGNSWDLIKNPTLSACGTSPGFGAANSSDISGIVSVGTGAVTSCTITFTNVWTNVPRCYPATSIVAANPVEPTITTSSLVVTSAATMGGGTLFYHCDGGW